MKFGHDTLMGPRWRFLAGWQSHTPEATTRILLILTLIGAAVTLVIGVLLFFGLA
jgi:hypothetical protein